MALTLVGTPELVSSVATRSSRSSVSFLVSLSSATGSIVTTSDVRFSTSTRPLSS